MQKIIGINRFIDFFLEDFYLEKSSKYSDKDRIKNFGKLVEIRKKQIKNGKCSNEYRIICDDVTATFIKWKTLTAKLLGLLFTDARTEEIIKRRYGKKQSMIKTTMEMYMSKEAYYACLKRVHDKFLNICCYARLIVPEIAHNTEDNK